MVEQHDMRVVGLVLFIVLNIGIKFIAYSGAAEPPVRRGVSHVSGPDGATLLELM